MALRREDLKRVFQVFLVFSIVVVNCFAGEGADAQSHLLIADFGDVNGGKITDFEAFAAEAAVGFGFGSGHGSCSVKTAATLRVFRKVAGVYEAVHSQPSSL